MRRILFLHLLLLAACQGNDPVTSSNSQGTPKDSFPQLESEKTEDLPIQDTIPFTNDLVTFKTLFLEKFSSDSSFQISFTKFPVIEKGYERNLDQDVLYRKKIFMKGWTHINLQYDSSAYYQKYDKYIQEFDKRGNDTIYVNFRGIDNGIFYGYAFAKDSVWKLVSIYDFSN